jgi:hypothetical protein
VVAADPVVVSPPVTVNPSVAIPVDPWQTVRYLRVANRTGQDLTVYVQTPDDEEPLAWQLAPDQTADLGVDGERLAAAQVWIWAESESAAWTDYQDEPLTLVEEAYRSPRIGTYTYAFDP